MTCTYILVPASEQKISTWSGGTTTELAIFPPSASYSARNFQWRLSTAVVTAAESTFTSLPGYQRLLMVLTGQMHLEHSGQHQITLLPFEQDSFSGGWLTHCAGTGRDFNLMLAGGWQGSLQAIRLSPNDAVSVEMSRLGMTEAFYCLSGQAQFVLPDGTELSLGAGDFLLLSPNQPVGRLQVAAQTGPADLVHASIGAE